LLEPNLEGFSAKRIRQHFPFLFKDPIAAEPLLEWGKQQVGYSCKQTPSALQTLFRWDAFSRSKHVSVSVAYGAKKATVGAIKTLAHMAVDPNYRESRWKLRNVHKMLPGRPGLAHIFGKPFHFADCRNFLSDYNEVFQRQVYRI